MVSGSSLWAARVLVLSASERVRVRYWRLGTCSATRRGAFRLRTSRRHNFGREFPPDLKLRRIREDPHLHARRALRCDFLVSVPLGVGLKSSTSEGLPSSRDRCHSFGNEGLLWKVHSLALDACILSLHALLSAQLGFVDFFRAVCRLCSRRPRWRTCTWTRKRLAGTRVLCSDFCVWRRGRRCGLRLQPRCRRVTRATCGHLQHAQLH